MLGKNFSLPLGNGICRISQACLWMHYYGETTLLSEISFFFRFFRLQHQTRKQL